VAVLITPVTTAIPAGTTVACYTVPTSSPTVGYAHDVIVMNGNASSGTAFTVFVGASSASTTTAMGIPSGGQMFLQAPTPGAVIYATCVSAATMVIGLGSVVSAI
jgi:hypothetical protein